MVHLLTTIQHLLVESQREECKERVPQVADTICRGLAAGHLQKIFNLVIHGKYLSNGAVRLSPAVHVIYKNC